MLTHHNTKYVILHIYIIYNTGLHMFLFFCWLLSTMKVTPWEVEGKVDYDKLVKEFGTQKIDDKLLAKIKKDSKELHMFLRRGFYFSHRDLNLVLDDYDKGKGFFLYTFPHNLERLTKLHAQLVPLIRTLRGSRPNIPVYPSVRAVQ